MLTSLKLPDGGPGIELRYLVNNPERFEQAVRGPVTFDDGDGSVSVINASAAGDETTYTFRFEPLTLSLWKGLGVVDSEELSSKVVDDASLRNYYWQDWVPDYWTESEPEG
jgi:hypothetical protein